jgi:uncharacterized membrane protein YgdD (TMEM256/DUF423 family)
MKRLSTNLYSIVGVLGALGISLGALGAHLLRSHLEPSSLDSYKTAVLYHLLHTVALFICAHNPNRTKNDMIMASFFLSGILLFSGSIYFLSTRELHGLDVRWMGPITPVGGVLFICGWLTIIFKKMKND